MKKFDLFKNEKDTIYRVQLAIAKAPVMSKDILRELINQLGYSVTSDGYRAKTVNDYVGYWWDYVGQWAWDQMDIRGKNIKMIASGILNNNPNIKDATYPDEGLVFTKELRPSDGEDLTFWAEIKDKEGKTSLWPRIYELKVFGEIGSMIDNSYHVGETPFDVAFAFRRAM